MSHPYNNISDPIPFLNDRLPPHFGPPRRLVSHGPITTPTAGASYPRALLVHAARASKSASPTAPIIPPTLVYPQSPIDASSESSASSSEPYPGLNIHVPPPSFVPLVFPLPPALVPFFGHLDPSLLTNRVNMPKAAADKETKSRSSKKDVDPNKPKRALSAYMFFVQDYRDRIKSENPDVSFGEVGKLLGAKWKELSASEKKPYNDKAEADKGRAAKEKAAYEKK